MDLHDFLNEIVRLDSPIPQKKSRLKAAKSLIFLVAGVGKPIWAFSTPPTY